MPETYKKKQPPEKFQELFLNKGNKNIVRCQNNLLLFVSILQCQVTFLAGSDLDNVFDVVYENFSITDLTGMKNFLGGFDTF